jgi:ribosomal protein S12
LATTKQSLKRKKKNLKISLKYTNPKKTSRTPILKTCPQTKGIVTRVVTMTPKKT